MDLKGILSLFETHIFIILWTQCNANKVTFYRCEPAPPPPDCDVEGMEATEGVQNCQMIIDEAIANNPFAACIADMLGEDDFFGSCIYDMCYLQDNPGDQLDASCGHLEEFGYVPKYRSSVPTPRFGGLYARFV